MKEPWMVVATQQRPAPSREEDVVGVTVIDFANNNWNNLTKDFGRFVRATSLTATKIQER